MPRAYARDCDHCGRPIVLLRTVWGSERPWRAYEPYELPVADVGPLSRYAWSRRRGGVMQCDPTADPDDPTLPARVLVQHYCGRPSETSEVDTLVDAWLRGEAPDTGRRSVRRSNLGFRRGFGRQPPPP